MIRSLSPNTGDPVARPTDGASAPAEESVATRLCSLSRSLLADGEVVILELKPSLWFIPLLSAPIVGVGLIVLLLANSTFVGERLVSWQPALRQVGLWIIILRVVWAMLQWMCRVYVLTDRRVIRQRGVLNLQVFECPLDRLQNTFLQCTLVQRVLGLGTIFFATAGTGAVEAMWQHIRRPADVHREITKAVSRFRKLNGDNSV